MANDLIIDQMVPSAQLLGINFNLLTGDDIIGHSPFYPESRCFVLVRNDGTTDDFSYRKCVVAAAKQISTDFSLTVEKELYRTP